jgi:hypothetical protein
MYVHNPIHNQQDSTSSSSDPSPDPADSYFGLSRFVPGKYGIPTEFDNVQQEDRPTFDDLQLFYQNNSNRKKQTIFEIGFPEDAMKNHPEIYSQEVLDELQGYINTSIKPQTSAFSKKTNIAVHIADLTKEKETYYLSLIDTLNKLYGMDDSNICIIATETKKGILDIYREKKNVTVLANLDFLTMFQYLSTANVLVMSPTSTSYLAALYTNKKTTKDIYYTDDVYPKLDGWKNIKSILATNPQAIIEDTVQNAKESFTSEFVESYEKYDKTAFFFWINIIMAILIVLFVYFIVKEILFSFSWKDVKKSLFRIVRS